MAPKHYKAHDGASKQELEPQFHLEIPADATPGVDPATAESEKAWDLHEQEVVTRLGQSALPHWTERPVDVRPERKDF